MGGPVGASLRATSNVGSSSAKGIDQWFKQVPAGMSDRVLFDPCEAAIPIGRSTANRRRSPSTDPTDERGQSAWGAPRIRRGSQKILVIMRNRPVLRRRSIGQIKHDLVHVTPPPTLWRIVALNNRMTGLMEMLGCVSVRRTVTAADVSARSADAQVNPRRSQFQTFLTSACARLHVADAVKMIAPVAHN